MVGAYRGARVQAKPGKEQTMATTRKSGKTSAKQAPAAKAVRSRLGAAQADAPQAQIERIKRLIRARGQALVALPNITSIGIGYKHVDGKPTRQLALQFTVQRKLAPQGLATEGIAAIAPTIEFEGVQIPTDIVQRSFEPSYVVVQLEPKSERKTRQDPIRGGISVAHETVTAGTLGAIVRDAATGAPLILSNWHVLSGALGKPGDTIVQPGPFDDSETAGNKVGALLRSHLGLAGDCAVATIEQRKVALDQVELATEIRQVGKPELGDLVIKSGRTTGVTYGMVSRIEGVFKIAYEGIGEQQIGGFEIVPSPAHPAPENEISRGGDSGSAWIAVDANGAPTDIMLGLHFAGDAEGSTDEVALACYAHSVFQKLEIEPQAAGADPNLVPPADAALRGGFAPDFLAYAVPMPGYAGAVAADLVGLGADGRTDYCHFSVWLSRVRKLPLCVAWNIDGSRKQSLSRKGIDFVKDERDGLAEFQHGNELYVGNDLDRGHVARRDDLVWGDGPEARQANVDSFFFTNMTPQHKAFNQSFLSGKWGLLENAILDDVVLRDLRVSLMAGPVLDAGDPLYRGVQIPREFWKAVFFTDDEDGANKARAFILTQRDLLEQMQPEALALQEFRWYQVPLATIEQRVGIRFDAALHRIDTQFPQALGPRARLVVGGNFFGT
jgi:endonuclease G, mitochondrial